MFPVMVHDEKVTVVFPAMKTPVLPPMMKTPPPKVAELPVMVHESKVTEPRRTQTPPPF